MKNSHGGTEIHKGHGGNIESESFLVNLRVLCVKLFILPSSSV